MLLPINYLIQMGFSINVLYVICLHPYRVGFLFEFLKGLNWSWEEFQVHSNELLYMEMWDLNLIFCITWFGCFMGIGLGCNGSHLGLEPGKLNTHRQNRFFF